MSACRESELDALLANELASEDATRVRAHVSGCTACQHALTWLRAERGWMAQRAQRTPARPALDFAALEARLQEQAPPPRPEPRHAGWMHWGRMLSAATAVVAFISLSTFQMTRIPSADEPWGPGDAMVSLARPVDWCDDPSREAVAALEARVGACLVATPFLPLR